MALTDDKTALDELSLGDLRQLGRDEIEELVTDGLLEADRADTIFSEDNQKRREQEQSSAVMRSQAQAKKEEQREDEDWLQHMSQSYQTAYLELMDTYDAAENEYGSIKTRAEKVKDHLRDKIQNAYQDGIPLPDGEIAFYDRKHDDFVDGTSLQRLQGEDAKIAAKEFTQLSTEQQKANASYVDACTAYDDAASISRSADAGSLDVKNAKLAAETSHGSLSEAHLVDAKKDANAKVDALSARLNKAEDADADLDAALGLNKTDAALAADNGVSASRNVSQPQPLSFANQIDPNAVAMGDGNGKTATSFNMAASLTPAAVEGQTIAPDNRIASAAPAPVR